MRHVQLWIGTYTPEAGSIGRAEGIYRARFDPDTGELTEAAVAARTPCPSWLVAHPAAPVLYCVNELARGSVSAFEIASDGSLRLLGSRATWYTAPDAPHRAGDFPCHAALDAGARRLLVADYGSGMVSVHPLVDSGTPGDLDEGGEYLEADRHLGGPDPDRQAGPHAHFVLPMPDGRTVLVSDLGADRLRRYRLGEVGEPTGEVGGGCALPAGCGPRHMLLHPNGDLYLTGELDSTLVRLRLDADGAPRVLDAVPASAHRPDGPCPRPYPAHLALGPTGRFLYVSVRGPDVLAVHRVGDDGATAHVADVPSGGACPRHFAVVGEHLLVAHQDSDEIVVHALDPVTGVPEPTGRHLSVPSPVCLLPVP